MPNPALPTLDALRCFEAAAQLPSFRAAARAVGVTPAALGQRIRQLEEQLGTPLFRRSTRQVALTDAGLKLLPRARAALGAALDCVRAARGEIGPPPMDLTIGTRYELGQSFLLPNLSRLTAAHPGLFVHLYIGGGPDLFTRLRSREIDCAVTSARLTDPQLDYTLLQREDYAFVGAPRLLRRLPLRRAEDAAQHTLLDVHADLPLYRYFREADGAPGERLRFARVWRLGGVGYIRALVLAGEGVAVLPLYMVREDLARRRLQRLLPSVKPRFDYFRLVFRADDPRRAAFDGIARTLAARPLT
jgi:LysR family transcriptional regulator, glycine cleavage system transcriptional activator